MAEEQTPSFFGDETGLEIEKSLAKVAAELGFIQTDSLKLLEKRLSDNKVDDELSDLISAWQLEARKIVTEQTNPTDPKPQVGLLVASIQVFLRCGRLDDARFELDDAITYANGIGDIATVNQLAEILMQLDKR